MNMEFQPRTPASAPAPKFTPVPQEAAEINKKIQVLFAEFYAMGRNDSERNSLYNVLEEYTNGKINYTQALEKLNSLQDNKNRGDYN